MPERRIVIISLIFLYFNPDAPILKAFFIGSFDFMSLNGSLSLFVIFSLSTTVPFLLPFLPYETVN